MRDLHARAMGKAVIVAQFSEIELLQHIERTPLNKHTPKIITNKEDLLADLKFSYFR